MADSLPTLSVPELAALIAEKRPLELHLEYRPDSSGGHFYLFCVGKGQKFLIRGQRGEPRKYRDIRRAFAFGHELGFRSVSVKIDYASYVPDAIAKLGPSGRGR